MPSSTLGTGCLVARSSNQGRQAAVPRVAPGAYAARQRSAAGGSSFCSSPRRRSASMLRHFLLRDTVRLTVGRTQNLFDAVPRTKGGSVVPLSRSTAGRWRGTDLFKTARRPSSPMWPCIRERLRPCVSFGLSACSPMGERPVSRAAEEIDNWSLPTSQGVFEEAAVFGSDE